MQICFALFEVYIKNLEVWLAYDSPKFIYTLDLQRTFQQLPYINL